ncbi:anthranilate phosphoribosyltransferase [Candidatus Nitrosocosmicus franklandus]|uniref:Anthranilate phosphoribosyltransferase n=1 Tax=Candidatus Nitrosocosmicus franklandianus TaxID=1798806 RepID=A0A484I8J5_9ARCH|nr:anthranilate phosphoribosyltransferase [Candidatus Nitrosocosmicus franklandus]VFJ13053.1 Anthranilate phosphoribosyltransferase [Candidatus Nitrosocosmicus franklandus]
MNQRINGSTLAKDSESKDEGHLLFNKLILGKLSRREHLSQPEINKVIKNIINGDCSDIFTSAFLMGLQIKGETDDEFSGVIEAIRTASINITLDTQLPLVDNCGTGGDMLNTFNISTAAAIIASSCNRVAIAKHGNRSSSGLSGSADMLEHIGYPLEHIQPDRLSYLINQNGFGFLFAPNYHPGLKHVSRIRRELGVQTVFNKIGPLCNPCTNLNAQVIGVSNPFLLSMIPKIIPILGLKRAMIIRSEEGMDELSTTGRNHIVHVISEDGDYKIHSEILEPSSLGIKPASIRDLMVKNKMDAINESLRVIYGFCINKPKEDIVLLNSAAVLLAGNSVESMDEGLSIVRESVREGRPQKLLRNVINSIGDMGKLELAEKAL